MLAFPSWLGRWHQLRSFHVKEQAHTIYKNMHDAFLCHSLQRDHAKR